MIHLPLVFLAWSLLIYVYPIQINYPHQFQSPFFSSKFEKISHFSNPSTYSLIPILVNFSLLCQVFRLDFGADLMLLIFNAFSIQLWWQQQQQQWSIHKSQFLFCISNQGRELESLSFHRCKNSCLRIVVGLYRLRFRRWLIVMAAPRSVVVEAGNWALDRDEEKNAESPSGKKLKAERFPLSRWELAAALGVFFVFSAGLLSIYLTMPAAEYGMLKLPRTLSDLRSLK